MLNKSDYTPAIKYIQEKMQIYYDKISVEKGGEIWYIKMKDLEKHIETEVK